jgi:hypothetical protein
MQANSETLLFVIHKLVNSIWSKPELPDKWKETYCTNSQKIVIKLTHNYRGMSLLSVSLKMLLHIPVSTLSSYRDEIIGDGQCEFHLTSTADQIFCIHRVLEKQ